MIDKIKSRRQDKAALYREVVAAGGKPSKNNMFHCPYHNDKTASAWIKKSHEGYYYFKCFVCNIWLDVIDFECRTKNKTFSEVISESGGSITKKHKQYYDTIKELIESLNAIEVEEINQYTNPQTGNVDLLTVRYLARGGNKKEFSQAYQTPQGFLNKRPAGLLPLFNRTRVENADTVVFVEGEKVVRFLTNLGYTATTGSGGSSNAHAHDFSPLAGKTVILWADNDSPGIAYMEQVSEKLLELDPLPKILSIDIKELDLPDGGDAVDLCEKIKAESGTDEDCKSCLSAIFEDAVEYNKLSDLEAFLDDMRDGNYTNLPLSGFPILTNEAMMLLNKKIGVIYGNAGFGKSLFIGKICDDLRLGGERVARLQLEDEREQHLLRSFAQQSLRSELCTPDYHLNHKLESKLLYDQFKPTLDIIADSVFSGEHESWDDTKILDWIENQFKIGKTLVVIDPISVIMTDKVWITSHRLMWGAKKILAKYPNGRIVLVSHNNTEGEVAGGQAYKRFCHSLFTLSKFKQPKNVRLLDIHGEETITQVEASIGIVKTRYGRGNGLEVAVKLNTDTLCMEEIGVILEEIKPTKQVGRAGRDLDNQPDSSEIPF